MNQKQEMYKSFESFREIPLNKERTEFMLSEVLQIDSTGELSTRKQNQKDELLQCIEREKKDLGNTLWSAFNGVTYWTTHVKEAKQKVFGNVAGGMLDLNMRAFTAAKQIEKQLA